MKVPSELCTLEDATAGVEGARRTGIKCIAVMTTNPAEALHDADIVVDRLDALTTDAFDRLTGKRG